MKSIDGRMHIGVVLFERHPCSDNLIIDTLFMSFSKS
ncbi:hypothetical protein [Orbus wheelerorum]